MTGNGERDIQQRMAVLETNFQGLKITVDKIATTLEVVSNRVNERGQVNYTLVLAIIGALVTVGTVLYALVLDPISERLANAEAWIDRTKANRVTSEDFAQYIENQREIDHIRSEERQLAQKEILAARQEASEARTLYMNTRMSLVDSQIKDVNVSLVNAVANLRRTVQRIESRLERQEDSHRAAVIAPLLRGLKEG